MKPHQLRVVIEKAELDLKIAALSEFLGTSPIYPTLPPPEQLRLTRQYKLMSEYSDVLSERIGAF